jgi:hypothetical protein
VLQFLPVKTAIVIIPELSSKSSPYFQDFQKSIVIPVKQDQTRCETSLTRGRSAAGSRIFPRTEN